MNVFSFKSYRLPGICRMSLSGLQMVVSSHIVAKIPIASSASSVGRVMTLNSVLSLLMTLLYPQGFLRFRCPLYAGKISFLKFLESLKNK